MSNKYNVDVDRFQREFDKSVDNDRWTELMGSYMLKLVDSVALNVGISVSDSVMKELKGFVIETLVINLWKYSKSKKESRAMYYAIAIIRNKFRRLARTMLGGKATKTLQGTDSFWLVEDKHSGRMRKRKATYVSVDYIDSHYYSTDSVYNKPN